MELGEKLLQARLEAGLSQRQLCGDVITRNMLSLIEHGAARPSMDTLRYLAGKLGKPMSYFLEEDVVTSANQSLMQQVRAAWQAGEIEKTRQLLQEYRFPDETYEWERRYLASVSGLAAAEQALNTGKYLYARQLLEETDVIPELERKKQLLFGRIPGADLQAVVGQLPSLDEELLLRAEAALAKKKTGRAVDLLAAVENREAPHWNLLQGRVLLLKRQYASAVDCLQKAETAFPKVCWPLLETCFRELGDFKQAYDYACRQK